MTTSRRGWTQKTALLGVLALLAGAGLARGADETPSFKNRGEVEKRFVGAVGTAIVKAAHFSAKKPELVSYKYESPKPNRTELKIKMEYSGQISGKVTKKRYVANIVVKIDSTNKDAWEVLNIDYTDNNNIPHSEKKVQALIKKFNK